MTHLGFISACSSMAIALAVDGARLGVPKWVLVIEVVAVAGYVFVVVKYLV